MVLLICQKAFVDNAKWTGIPVAELLSAAHTKPEARKVIFHSIDGFQQEFSLEDVQADGVFLAYKVNGETLPIEQGFPLRLVVTGDYGFYWVKWVDLITVR